jgi:hypothetical protein
MKPHYNWIIINDNNKKQPFEDLEWWLLVPPHGLKVMAMRDVSNHPSEKKDLVL